MNPDAEAPSQQSLLQAKLQEVADETGHLRQTVAWVFTNVVSRDQAGPPQDGKRRGLSAEALCEKLIRNVNETFPGELRAVLEANRIFRSEDIGEIVTALVDKELLVREEDDFFTDFDDLFQIEHLGAYLAARGIRRRWMAPGVPHRISLVLYTIGGTVIVAGWLDRAKIPYCWLGAALCLAGWLISLWPRRRTTSPENNP